MEQLTAKREVLVSLSDVPDCRNIECLFSNQTYLDDVTAISALLELGFIPKIVVVKNDGFPTAVSIIPQKKWDIKCLANDICHFLEGENLIVRKFYKSKKFGKWVVMAVGYF